MNLKRELLAVTGALRRAGIEYALCGGMAVAIHGYPRATRDIDILIQPDDLLLAEKTLAACGDELTSGIIPFDTGKPTERRIFRISKAEGKNLLTLDLILLPKFLEKFWKKRESRLLERRKIQVISKEGLICMKRLAGRPLDLADISILENQKPSKWEQKT